MVEVVEVGVLVTVVVPLVVLEVGFSIGLAF